MNINDDNRLPNTYDLTRFDLELWRVDRYWGIIKKWDKKLVSGDDYYSINQPGHSETLKVDIKDESEQVKYEAKVKVETIGIGKANTIAIYETNGTVFNGHYQEQERMNVIQLYVNDSGSGTPFEEGLNTILIPTSLFTETIFNAHVQNETLNATTIYRDDEELFKFISVDRDGETEQACEEIDFIIIRFDISSEDAMEVLNLLLECLVNETTNETEIVYSYVSKKQNGKTAVMMNLPFSVLGLIPWYCNFSNSPMGSKPETFEDWFWKPLATIGMFIVGVIVTIGMAFVELFTMMIDFFIIIFMDILPILGYILWLIIRAIILILSWIIFVFTLLLMILLLVTIMTFMYSIALFLDINISMKINRINVSGQFNFTFGYKISFEYISFLKISLPILIGYMNSTDFMCDYSTGLFSTYFNFSKFPNDILDRVFNDSPQQSSGILLKSSNSISDEELMKRICEGMMAAGTTMGFSSALIGIIAGSMTLYKDSPQMKAVYIIGIIAFGLSLTLLLLSTFIFRENFPPWVLFGMGIGLVITGIVCLTTMVFMNKHSKFMKDWSDMFGNPQFFKNLSIIDTLFAGLGSTVDITEFIAERLSITPDQDISTYRGRATTSLMLGFLSEYIAAQALVVGGKYDKAYNRYYMDKGDKTIIGSIFGGIFFSIGIYLIIRSLTME